ncbi:hypothetical protein [Maricaulis sp.]|uniref:hypothetical protein n=1 Tax=Maricaulis sp. TaxID=1486257 RepID=UPI003A94D40C
MNWGIRKLVERIPPWAQRLGTIVITFVAVAVGYFQFWFLFLEHFVENKTIHDAIAISSLFILMFLLILMHVVKEVSYRRHLKYYECLDKMHSALHNMRNIVSSIGFDIENNGDNAELLKRRKGAALIAFQTILTDVKDMFELIAGSSCRACIKSISTSANGDDLLVLALQRDHFSAERCRELDRKRLADNVDLMSQNSYFNKSYSNNNNSMAGFIINNIHNEPGFTTTSVHAYDDGRERKPRDATQVLPYVSAITYAIRQLEDESAALESVGCIGFLAVDSKAPKAFLAQDLNLMAALADGLFHPVNSYRILLGRIEALTS